MCLLFLVGKAGVGEDVEIAYDTCYRYFLITTCFVRYLPELFGVKERERRRKGGGMTIGRANGKGDMEIKLRNG